MKPLRSIDWDAAPINRAGGYKGQILYSGESCHIIATLVPPGVEGPPTHVHPSDQLYFIVSGRLELELGTEVCAVEAGQGVFIPAGVPHHNRNVSSEPEVHLEVIAPGVPPTQPLATMVDSKDAQGLPYFVGVPERPKSERPFTMSWLANRAKGSQHAGIYVADMAPGAAGPPTHIHEFDQFYFVLEGALDVEVGLQRHQVGPNTLVVLPAGVPHKQRNAHGDVKERHLAILVPEPLLPSSPEHRWDTVVDFAEAAHQLD